MLKEAPVNNETGRSRRVASKDPGLFPSPQRGGAPAALSQERVELACRSVPGGRAAGAIALRRRLVCRRSLPDKFALAHKTPGKFGFPQTLKTLA